MAKPKFIVELLDMGTGRDDTVPGAKGTSSLVESDNRIVR